MTTTTTTTHPAHQTTGRPIVMPPTFTRGDLVTESFLGDGTPGIVVKATAKTVWVQPVAYQLGNVTPGDVPGYNGYGDSATLVIDPEAEKKALERGTDGATKYVLRINRHACDGTMAEQELHGGTHHRAGWRLPNSKAGSLSAGARYRRDPHV